MPTKPGANFAPRPRKDAPSNSAKEAFLDVSKLDADRFTKATIRIPKSLYKDVKTEALRQEISIQDYICSVLLEKLENSSR